MTENDWILGMALVTLFTLGVMYSINIIRTDTYANQKRLTRLTIFLYLTSFIAWILSTFYFRVNETYQIYMLAAILLLVCLPASLFSLSVSTITSGNI
jgi:hypothetical protein